MSAERAEAAPIPMILFCPACGVQHIDAPEANIGARGDRWETAWNNPPHRSHLCMACDHIWRPADVPTTGVASITTKGSKDSPVIRGCGRPATAGDRS